MRSILRTCCFCVVLSMIVCTPVFAVEAAGSLGSDFNPNIGGGREGYFFTSAVQPDGRIIIGGAFTTVDNKRCENIARLNADGSLDHSFNIGSGIDSLHSFVSCVVLQFDGKIVIGGEFPVVSGETHKSIVRLNVDGRVETRFMADVTLEKGGEPERVSCIALQPDGKLIIGGAFGCVNGEERNFIARLNSDGSLDANFDAGPGASANVNCVALQPDGKILIGGDFSMINHKKRNHIARLNADGRVDTSFDIGAGTDDLVYALALQPDGKILVGGHFNKVDDCMCHGLARLNPDGSLDKTFNTGSGVTGRVYTVAIQSDGKILIGGLFLGVDDRPCANIARLNSNGSLDTTVNFEPGIRPNRRVTGLALKADGSIIMSGSFTAVNGKPGSHYARLSNGASIQKLSVPDTNKVCWERNGSSPEVQQVVFELSIDGGKQWVPLGSGTRGLHYWELNGLSLPSDGLIRARACAGEGRGSTGVVEQIQPFSFYPPK